MCVCVYNKLVVAVKPREKKKNAGKSKVNASMQIRSRSIATFLVKNSLASYVATF